MVDCLTKKLVLQEILIKESLLASVEVLNMKDAGRIK